MKKVNLFVSAVLLIALCLQGFSAVSAAGNSPLPSSVTSSMIDKGGGINPGDFVKGIDNPFLPMKPGTTFIYRGTTPDGKEHVEVVITHKTKVIIGVRCIEVKDTVLLNGELEEATRDWFAQDKKGNVWYFGEDSKTYENGEVVSTEGSWLAGVHGAKPGIVMEAKPKVGDKYQQENAEDVAEDRAEVISLDGEAKVPYGSFDDLLVTKETTPLEPGFAEKKYYAKGVGLVLAKIVKGGSGQEVLVDIQHDD